MKRSFILYHFEEGRVKEEGTYTRVTYDDSTLESMTLALDKLVQRMIYDWNERQSKQIKDAARNRTE